MNALEDVLATWPLNLVPLADWYGFADDSAPGIITGCLNSFASVSLSLVAGEAEELAVMVVLQGQCLRWLENGQECGQELPVRLAQFSGDEFTVQVVAPIHGQAAHAPTTRGVPAALSEAMARSPGLREDYEASIEAISSRLRAIGLSMAEAVIEMAADSIETVCEGLFGAQAATRKLEQLRQVAASLPSGHTILSADAPARAIHQVGIARRSNTFCASIW